MFDLRGQDVKACPCGTQMWQLDWVIFDDDGAIAAYSTEMKCISCGSLATPPMPGV